MTNVLELLQLQLVQQAVLAALIVGAICCYLGVFVVLKRIVFVGAALAEVSALGAAAAALPVVGLLFQHTLESIPGLHFLEHYRPLVLAVLSMLLAVAFFSQQKLSRQLPREAIIGAVYAGAAGLTLLALNANPSGKEHAMEAIQGSIVGVDPLEIWEIGITAAVVGLVQFLFYKEFVLISFDPEVARTLGFRSSRWELGWYLTLGITIAVSIHVAGTILVFAYLVIPPVTALLLTRRLPMALTLSVLLGVLATVGGVLTALTLDWQPGPSIVAFCVAEFFVCWIGKTGVGLLGRTART